jgi:SAM-dependent methyltransferase
MKQDTSKSIIERARLKILKKIGRAKYGKFWIKRSNDWYSEIHDSNYLIHENFKKYLKSKSNIKKVIEIGCGTGIYPIKNKELFNKIDYTGIDISESAIEYCKQNSDFNFICGDFLKMDLKEHYDLVFSHAVIDHVYDIDKFIEKAVSISNNYVFINSYRGYFPDLEKHNMNWNRAEGCYYNDISIKQIRKILQKIGLNENQFTIKSQKSGQKDVNVDTQTIIEISKKKDNLY